MLEGASLETTPVSRTEHRSTRTAQVLVPQVRQWSRPEKGGSAGGSFYAPGVLGSPKQGACPRQATACRAGPYPETLARSFSSFQEHLRDLRSRRERQHGEWGQNR